MALGMSLLSIPASAREFDIDVGAGLSIHVIDQGPIDAKPPLVFVPGWRFTHSIWADQIAEFSGDRRVIAIDPRSQGASTMTAEGDTPEQRAKDLDRLFARLKIQRIVLVGWSQGVQDVAAYVAAFGTADVAGLVLALITRSQSRLNSMRLSMTP
jgi:non-heme chloroperoxidase